MTTVALVIFVVGLLTGPALALDAWDRRRAARAFDRHVAQAVHIVDDGRALVAEAEAFLKNGGRL